MATKSKKQNKGSEPSTESGNSPSINEEMVQQAVLEGLSVIEQGKSKIDAAMTIYRQLETLPQEVVVRAFIEGAKLTDKGALTYWYNCRRKLARERRD